MRRTRKIMNRSLMLIILVFMGLQSCDAQNYDLANIKFPLLKSTLDKYKLKDNKFLELHYRLFKSENPELLHFNKESLAGHTGHEYDALAGTNLVYFYSDDKTNKIHAYRIETYTTAESRKIIKSMQTVFGKPLMDRGKENRYRVWESADQKVIYLLEDGPFSVNNAPKTEMARLMVIDKGADDLFKRRLSGGFQYYQDYLDEKVKKKGKKYSYADFLKDMKAQGQDNYLKKDNTIK